MRTRPSTRLATAALVSMLAGAWPSTAASSSSPDPAVGGPPIQGTFDVQAVEELALDFAVAAVRKAPIPLTARVLQLKFGRINKQEMIAEIESDPPRIDEQGVVYPFGDKNPLSFVFDSGSRSLSCWARLVKMYGWTSAFGLTGPELAAALNAATYRPRDRGGADFAYDPIRDALSLKREYLHPPTERDGFVKEVNRLLSTQRKWEKRYLKEMEPIAEKRLRPDSAEAEKEGFGAALILRHFSVEPAESDDWGKRYLETWDRPPGGWEPLLTSDRELLVDQTMHVYVHFHGAGRSDRGGSTVNATYRLLAPGGELVFEQPDVPIWRDAALPRDHVQLGAKDLSFAIDEAEPTGVYRLEANVCDTATGRCVALVHPFELRSR